MKKLMIASIALAVACGVADARADEGGWKWSPLGVGIAAPIQLPWMSTDVYGLRFGGALGVNQNFYGVDCGVVGVDYGDVAGIQVDGFTWTSGSADAFQIGAIANVVQKDFYGAQFGLVNVVWNEFWGLQAGVVNYDVAFYGIGFGGFNWHCQPTYGAVFGAVNASQEDFTGWATGLINHANVLDGFQLGVVNTAYDATGLQLGVLNATDRLDGVQIGVFNLICEGPLPVMVIANAAF